MFICIKHQCALLNINRSSLYYKRNRFECSELHILNCIDEIHHDFPGFGARKVKQRLNRVYNINVGEKKTISYMKKMNVYRSNVIPYVRYPYLLKNNKVEKPNQVWGVDISYISLKNNYAFLVVIIDWYSRFVLSWNASYDLSVIKVIEALEKAIFLYSKPKIINSDGGAQFVSANYLEYLHKQQIKTSMSRPNKLTDNIIVERFFRSLKSEKLFIEECQNIDELNKNICFYVHEYNYNREHDSLENATPYEVFSNEVNK